jgi:hypothetical protein
VNDFKVRLTFQPTSRLLRFLGSLFVIFFIIYASLSPEGAAKLFKFAAGALIDIAVALGDFLVRLVT